MTLGLRDERAGDRHPLLLAAGELAREVPGPGGDAHPIEVLDRPAVPLAALDALVVERQGDVLGRRLEVDEVERLEDEPEELAPEHGGTRLREVRDELAVEEVLPLVVTIEEPEDVEQGRLPRARGAHDGHELAARDVEVDALEHVEPVGADRVALVDAAQAEHGTPIARGGLQRGRDRIPAPAAP